MMEFVQSLFTRIDPMMGYGLLLVSAFLENVVPPIPGDTVVVLGAYLVSVGYLQFWGVYISTTLGSVAGFLTMYVIGRRFGRSFIYKKSRVKIFKESHISKVEIWFGRWGYWVILFNRFLSGTRSVVSLFSGLFHLNFFLVSFLALMSALIWNALLIIAGMLLGDHWEKISGIISRYNQVFLVLIISVIAYIIYKRIRPRKDMNAEKN
jgi:membrane protein DedA with SNARE-associated domain